MPDILGVSSAGDLFEPGFSSVAPSAMDDTAAYYQKTGELDGTYIRIEGALIYFYEIDGSVRWSKSAGDFGSSFIQGFHYEDETYVYCVCVSAVQANNKIGSIRKSDGLVTILGSNFVNDVNVFPQTNQSKLLLVNYDATNNIFSGYNTHWKFSFDGNAGYALTVSQLTQNGILITDANIKYVSKDERIALISIYHANGVWAISGYRDGSKFYLHFSGATIKSSPVWTTVPPSVQFASLGGDKIYANFLSGTAIYGPRYGSRSNWDTALHTLLDTFGVYKA